MLDQNWRLPLEYSNNLSGCTSLQALKPKCNYPLWLSKESETQAGLFDLIYLPAFHFPAIRKYSVHCL